MKRLGIVSLLLCFATLTTAAGPATAVDYALSYSDPASDVVKLWTSNETPVRTGAGNLVMSPFPDAVNILWLRSTNESSDVNVSFEVKGDIANLANTTYEFNLYTRADNASHFIVRYSNGVTTLKSNATGASTQDISGNSFITAAGSNPTLRNKLSIRVSKALLGTVDVWNLDGTATQRGSVYTYRDFGWEVPGNPGSAPPTAPTPSVLPTWAWIVLAAAILAVLMVIVALVRRKRAPPQPK